MRQPVCSASSGVHTFLWTWLLAAMLLGTTSATAGPMGFQGSWMSMADMGPNWREVFFNYALTPRDAVGISNTYLRADDASIRRNLMEVTYTRLLRRWNQPAAQANLWFMGGIGEVYLAEEDRASGMISPGMQFDYETTRVYFSATQRLYRATAINHDYSAVRAGFSFFETSYESTQPWLLWEARYMHDLSDKIEITPMLRLINRRYFVEFGVNNSGQPRLNGMFIF